MRHRCFTRATCLGERAQLLAWRAKLPSSHPISGGVRVSAICGGCAQGKRPTVACQLRQPKLRVPQIGCRRGPWYNGACTCFGDTSLTRNSSWTGAPASTECRTRLLVWAAQQFAHGQRACKLFIRQSRRLQTGRWSSVLNQKFDGLQIDSMIADSPVFGEDWRWVDALLRWNWMR